MYIEPNGVVRFIKNCPITNYNNEINFIPPTGSSLRVKDVQYKYFNDLADATNITFEKVSFVKEERGYIRVNAPIGILHEVNYMMFRNTGFEDRWFYAFVLKADRVSDNVSSVVFRIDDFQSWIMQTDRGPQETLNYCFVEREHSTYDHVGENLVEENIGFGDKVYSIIKDSNGDFKTELNIKKAQATRVGICSTINFSKIERTDLVLSRDDVNPFFTATYDIPIDDVKDGGGCYKYNNYISGGRYYIFLKAGDVVHYENHDYVVTKADEALAEAIINQVIKDGHSDNIISMFMLPGDTLNYTAINNNMGWGKNAETIITEHYNTTLPETIGIASLNFNNPVKQIDEKVTFSCNSINGYRPKNNKLYTYPYTSISVSNQNGSELILKPEFLGILPPNQGGVYTDQGINIDNGELKIWNLTYSLMGTMSYPSSTRIAFPLYKGATKDYANSIEVGPYPLCSWRSGAYERWLAQNSAPMVANAFSSLMNMGYGQVGNRTTEVIGTERSPARLVNWNDDWQMENTHWAKRNITSSTPTSGAVSAAGNMVSNVANTAWSSLASMASASHLPEKTNGVSGNTNVLFDNDKQYGVIRISTVNRFDAECIDNYFTMFGYACKRVKRPQIQTRMKWNYVKTVGCELYPSSLPSDVQRSLCEIFNNGITLWHYRVDSNNNLIDTFNFGNYNEDNPTAV